MADEQQIEGLPEGAQLRPLGGESHQEIEGLPAGAELRPLTNAPDENTGGASGSWEPIPATPENRATRRNAQAQSGITPAMRAANPVNKAVETGLKYAPYVAAAAIPATDIAEAGSLKPLVPYVRGALKSAAASQIGRYAGREIGGLFGEKGAETGAQVGGWTGAVVGPALGPRTFSKLPFGLGRYVLSDEEYAGAQAEWKVAQRAADIKAGLREEKLPLPMRAHAEMEADIAAERQGRAGARNEMYEGLSSARNAREGAGQEYPGVGAPLPTAPTPEEQLTRAVKEGRAGKIPIRMPKPGEPPAPADAALLRNPGPIPPRATSPAWKTAVPEAPAAVAPRTVPAPAEPPWAARAARVRATPQFTEATPAAEAPRRVTSGDRPTLEAARAAAEAKAAGPYGISREEWLKLSDEEKARAAAEWEMTESRARTRGMIHAGRGAAPAPYLSNEVIGARRPKP